MKAAVVYESWFGNTREVASAIANELGNEYDVLLLTVDDPPPPLDEVDLLVVGGPTHAHGLSSAMTRKSALQQRAEAGAEGVGVRDWLRRLSPAGGHRAATFDTRIEKPVILVGSAARGIAKRLERHGFELVAPPESFFVVDTAGPLKAGELERAAAWAKSLAGRTVAAAV
jgi:hypothetical protein